jgi:hypothetical protein
VAGVWTRYKHRNFELLNQTKRLSFILLGCVCILFLYLSLFIFYNTVTHDLGDAYAEIAIILALISILFSILWPYYNFAEKYAAYTFEDDIQLKQERLKEIGESIELFYVPLHDLLTSYDENVISRAKSRRIIQINGHKHLAEPRVRGVFEEYVSDGVNSRKLLELVSRDIELLQNRFIELKAELKDE